jgi:hypothetical protein
MDFIPKGIKCQAEAILTLPPWAIAPLSVNHRIVFQKNN